jgi:hypothetical protein
MNGTSDSDANRQHSAQSRRFWPLFVGLVLDYSAKYEFRQWPMEFLSCTG